MKSILPSENELYLKSVFPCEMFSKWRSFSMWKVSDKKGFLNEIVSYAKGFFFEKRKKFVLTMWERILPYEKGFLSMQKSLPCEKAFPHESILHVKRFFYEEKDISHTNKPH